MVTSVLSFVCFVKDDPFEIQLEPEAVLFKVLPGNELTFKGGSPQDGSFKWVISVDYKSRVTQLFPEGHPYEIEVFENGILLQDWYKYMR
jgi:hypothetical protein